MILGNRALAEPVRRVRPARCTARARKRAHLAAFGRQVPPARAALSPDALARDPDRGAKRVGRRTLPVHRRDDRPHPHHRQHQVRFPASRRHRGAGQALARAVCAGPADLGRGQHARRRETIVLDAHRRVVEKFPDALLVLVPRHPQRFETVRRPARQAPRTLRQPLLGRGDPRRRRACCSATRWASS